MVRVVSGRASGVKHVPNQWCEIDSLWRLLIKGETERRRLFCKNLQKIHVGSSKTHLCYQVPYKFVRLRACVSEKEVSSTRAPQGTVLSVFCFMHVWGVSVMDKCEELVDHFVAWCGNNPLILNTNKKRAKKRWLWMVEHCRYLGIYLENRLLMQH